MVSKQTAGGKLLLLAGKKEKFAFRQKGLGFYAFRVKGDAEELVGHVRLAKRFSLRRLGWVGAAECGDINVDGSVERKGIGSMLLALCLLYSEGISEVIVSSKDIMLISFLKSRGFVGRWSPSDKLLASLWGAGRGLAFPSQVFHERKKPAFKVYVSA